MTNETFQQKGIRATADTLARGILRQRNFEAVSILNDYKSTLTLLTGDPNPSASDIIKEEFGISANFLIIALVRLLAFNKIKKETGMKFRSWEHPLLGNLLK